VTTPPTDDRTAALGREGRRQEGQSERHDDCCAESLDRPEADQGAEIRRERARCRGEAEEQESRDVGTSPAQSVAERSCGDDPGGEGEGIGVDDPGQVACAAAEVGMDGRQRGHHDQGIEGDQQVGAGGEQDGQPTWRRDDGTVGGRRGRLVAHRSGLRV
jgi:hypothetical protein